MTLSHKIHLYLTNQMPPAQTEQNTHVNHFLHQFSEKFEKVSLKLIIEQ